MEHIHLEGVEDDIEDAQREDVGCAVPYVLPVLALFMAGVMLGACAVGLIVGILGYAS